jgi:hypothetical protein
MFLSDIINIFIPTYRVFVDILPDMSIFIFIANYMVVIGTLPHIEAPIFFVTEPLNCLIMRDIVGASLSSPLS